MASVGSSASPLYSALPKGGTVGQILAKRSDASGDLAWTTQSGTVADPVQQPVGQYFDNRFLQASSANDTFSVGLGVTYYLPFFLSKSVTCSGMAAYVVSGSNGNASFGINTVRSDGFPGANLVWAQGATGFASPVTVTWSSITLAAGWLFLAVGGYSGAGSTLAGFNGSAHRTHTSEMNTGPRTGAQTIGYQDTSAAGIRPVDNPTVSNIPNSPSVPLLFVRF